MRRKSAFCVELRLRPFFDELVSHIQQLWRAFEAESGVQANQAPGQAIASNCRRAWN